MLPLSKLSSPVSPHRPLLDDGDEVEIFYEAVWHPATPMASDIGVLATRLAEVADADGPRKP